MLVTQCDPMHIFVYKDGLGRFATQKYTEPTPSNLVSCEIRNMTVSVVDASFCVVG